MTEIHTIHGTQIAKINFGISYRNLCSTQVTHGVREEREGHTHTKYVWRSSAHRTLLVNSSNSQNILATPATCRETCSVELCRSNRPTRFAHSSRWHCVVLPSDASPAPVPSAALWTSLPSAWLTASFAPLPAQQPSSRAQPQVWPTARSQLKP